MSLKLPRRFFGLTSRGEYENVPLTESAARAQDTDAPRAWALSCWDTIWTYRRRARNREITAAAKVVEASCESINAQKVVAQQKLDACTEMVLSAHRSKDKVGCLRALRRKKRLQAAVRGLEDFAYDLERKLDMLNELRTSRDVLDVVKKVGRVVANVEVDASLREAEEATTTFDGATDAMTELSQYMQDSASIGADVGDDDDALLLELEQIVAPTPPPPPTTAAPAAVASAAWPVAPQEAVVAREALFEM